MVGGVGSFWRVLSWEGEKKIAASWSIGARAHARDCRLHFPVARAALPLDVDCHDDDVHVPRRSDNEEPWSVFCLFVGLFVFHPREVIYRTRRDVSLDRF